MSPRLLWTLLLACLVAGAGAQIAKGKLPPRDQPFTPPNKWALVIGASDYKKLGALTYAAKDAEAFAQLLKDRFGFTDESMEVLTDSPTSTLKPTVDGVRSALQNQLADKRMSNGDLFIFYFSGHGVGTDKGDYLMPTDADAGETEKGLRVKSVVDDIVKAGLRNVLIIVDACRSGQKDEFGDELRTRGKEANIAVLLSCKPGERSYEYPQLGHGAFTSFLLKSLRSQDLLSPVTGTLWASKVAADVGEKVRNYTLRDYPSQPQTPTGWSEETMDVLLGAYPRKGEARFTLADITAETVRLDRKEYLDALRRFANSMFESNRLREYVETMRLVASVDSLSPKESFDLAITLGQMGRTLEMLNEFNKLGKGNPNDVWQHLARIYNPSRKIKPADRVIAAKAIWKLCPEDWAGLVAWSALNAYSSAADTREFLLEYLKAPSLGPKLKAFLEGHLEGTEGDWGEAESKWRGALGLDGDYPTESLLNISLFQAIVNQGKPERLLFFLTQRAADPGPDAAFWNLALAQYSKETNDIPKMMSGLSKALETDLSPTEMLRVIKIAGLRYLQFADRLIEQADRKPFVWKAMLAKALVHDAKLGQDAAAKAIGRAAEYGDDEFNVLIEVFEILQIQLAEAFENKAVDALKYGQLALVYSEIMAEKADEFGYDSTAWMVFTSYALVCEKLEQAFALYDLYLRPRLLDGTLDPHLRAPYFLAALQMQNTERIQELWKLGGIPGTDQSDFGWLMAMHLTLRDDIEAAKRAIPPTRPSRVFEITAKAFEAYLSAKAGGKPDLVALEKEARDEPSAMHWIALIYAERKDWTHAMPILEKTVMSRQQGFFFLQARASEIYFNRLIENKQFDKANAHAYLTMISGYGNPIYEKIHFGPEASIKQFVGEVEFQAAEFALPEEIDRGTLSYKVDTSGNLTGTAVIANKKKTIAGQVDRYGNVRATVQEEGKTWTLTGKIAPPGLYRSLEDFKSGVQAFLMLDAKGQARYLMGQPKPAVNNERARRLLSWLLLARPLKSQALG